MHGHFRDRRVINRRTPVRHPFAFPLDETFSPNENVLLAGQLGHGKIFGVEPVKQFVFLAHLVTQHCQIKHLYEMRDVQPGRLQMRLILSVGLGLSRIAILELPDGTFEASQKCAGLVQRFIRSRLLVHIALVLHRHRFFESGKAGFVCIR